MSGHLVAPVRSPMPPQELAEGLRAAHDFLVAASRATVPRLLELPSGTWGADAKREHVLLPAHGRPSLLSRSIEKHSFLEVVNQCATIERLIDTLVWVQTRDELRDATVLRCNPTTSSAAKNRTEGPPSAHDNDLVLRDSSGDHWRFEVSDVASGKDGNGKEKKDLMSLGVLPAPGADVRGWPDGRIFLVVSSDFAARLEKPTRHGLRLGLFHYIAVKHDGATRILEVRKGPVSL